MAHPSITPLRLAVAGCLALASLLAHADDYDVLRDRWQLRLTGAPRANTAATTTDAARSATDAAVLRSWRGMDTSASRQRLWPDLVDWSRSATLTENYRRLRAMALVYKQPDSSLHANQELARSIVNALDWLDANRYNPTIRYYDNWWEWQIGIPLAIGDIATLMYAELGDARLGRYLAAVDHFVPDPATMLEPDGRTRPGEQTGANRLDRALAVALRGILGKSGEKIAAGRDAVSQTLLYVTHGDGFYRDGSFIQHDCIPYAGSYGLSVIADMAQLLYLLKDSRWAIVDPNVSNVYAWVEDSYRPFVFNGIMIDTVTGRRVSRRTADDRGAARALMESLALLAQGAPKDKADAIRSVVRGWLLRDPGSGPSVAARPASSYGGPLLDAIARDASIHPADEPQGARLFPSQDRALLRGPGFVWSLSLFSDRISAFESGNDENLRAWWTGMGMTELYQTGPSPHADGYWATVDLKRLPGTTTDHSGEGKPKPWTKYANTSDWVGGAVLDGKVASLGMAFSTALVTGSKLRGKKSWMLFGDRILALGTGISTPDRVAVETIVENRLLDAARPRQLLIDGKARPADVDWKDKVQSVHWAHLGGGGFDAGVGYVFPTATTVSAWREMRQGRWSDVNSGSSTSKDNELISRSYAGLSIEHGMAPDRAAYAYVVLPGRSAAQTEAFAAKPSITVLANTPEVSAACDSQLDAISVNLWAPLVKPLQVGGRDWLRSSGGLALTAMRRGDVLEISLADPSQKLDGTVIVELDEPVVQALEVDPQITVEQTRPALRLSIRFAGLAGSSVKARFRQGESRGRTALCPSQP